MKNDVSTNLDKLYYSLEIVHEIIIHKDIFETNL